MQPFPHPSDATHKIWSRLANWLQRYSILKVWTITDDGPLVYYKLTLWAFGSGELKMPLNSLPDADHNLPEMKTKSPSCPAGGVHMYDDDSIKNEWAKNDEKFGHTNKFLWLS